MWRGRVVGRIKRTLRASLVVLVALLPILPGLAEAVETPDLQTGSTLTGYAVGLDQTVTAKYKIYNPSSSPQSVGLGMSLKRHGTDLPEYYDKDHDTVETVGPGSTELTRQFKIKSAEIAPGQYDWILAIWSGTPGSSTWYDSTGWETIATLDVRQVPIIKGPKGTSSPTFAAEVQPDGKTVVISGIATHPESNGYVQTLTFLIDGAEFVSKNNMGVPPVHEWEFSETWVGSPSDVTDHEGKHRVTVIAEDPIDPPVSAIQHVNIQLREQRDVAITDLRDGLNEYSINGKAFAFATPGNAKAPPNVPAAGINRDGGAYLKFKNTGNLAQTFTVTATPPADLTAKLKPLLTWQTEWTVNQTTVSLGPGNEATIGVYLEVPADYPTPVTVPLPIIVSQPSDPSKQTWLRYAVLDVASFTEVDTAVKESLSWQYLTDVYSATIGDAIDSLLELGTFSSEAVLLLPYHTAQVIGTGADAEIVLGLVSGTQPARTLPFTRLQSTYQKALKISGKYANLAGHLLTLIDLYEKLSQTETPDPATDPFQNQGLYTGTLTISPTQGAPDQPTTLDILWDGAFNGVGMRYQLWLGTSPSQLTQRDCPAAAPTDPSKPAWTGCHVVGLAPGTHHWKVKATDNQGRWAETPVFSFSTVGTPGDPPTSNRAPVYTASGYLYPSNEMTVNGNEHHLAWDSLFTDPDGDPLFFAVRLAADAPPTPETVVCAEAENRATSCYVNTIKYLESHTYYWQVVVNDRNGGITDGPVWSFHTGNAGNRSPEYVGLFPVSPADDPTGTGATVTTTIDLVFDGAFREPDGDRMVYDVFTVDLTTGVEERACFETLRTGCIVNHLQPGHRYQWYAVAKDRRGGATKSAVWQFRT